jgi:tetratricopeptide (TPR) repeat protein/tRNA A-37 threonylcarbamoyl transferase component Bud32
MMAEQNDQDAHERTAVTVAHHPALPLSRAGRYTVKHLHARGGMGEVWLAQDTDIGRDVALKRLRSERKDQVQRFLVEAQVTGQLEHPGVVPLYDLGTDEDGRPFYVMSFVGGRTFKDVIADFHSPNPSTEEPREVQRLRLLEVFVQLCRTVAYAHSKGVIHRDLKPDNVMIGRYGETIVLDWGLAKVRGDTEEAGGAGYVHLASGSAATETMCGVIIGAPPYMAPEVAEGKGSEADERTDVYLLGATLYEMLTGRAPRQGSSRDEMIELARTVPPVPPRQVNPQVPRALNAICLRALAHRKQDRYASALELAQEVERYLAGEPVAACPESFAARAWRWCKRHRRALTRSAAAVVVLGLALLGVGLVLQSKRQTEEARQEAAVLQHREQARADVREFRRLAGQLHFDAAGSDAPGEPAPFFEHTQAGKAGLEALALARVWGKQLEHLPLPEERAALKTELCGVLLLLVQLQSEHQKERPLVQEQLDRLDRAEALDAPSRSLHRLRARCYEQMGERNSAAQEKRLAGAAGTPWTALDHFLDAEQYRRLTSSPDSASAEPPGGKEHRARLGKAIAAYRAALELEPDHYWAHYQIGRCLLSLGQASQAVEALGTCVALKPEVPWARSARGLALVTLGRFAEAERDLDRALKEEEPRFYPALLNRGVLHWRQRKYDQARTDFSAVLAAPPEQRLIEAAYYRGQVELECGQYAAAVKDFDLVEAERPGFWPVYRFRARAHLWRKQDERGLADLGAYLAKSDLRQITKAEEYERRGVLLRQLLTRDEVPKEPARRLAVKQLLRAEELGRRSARLYCELVGLYHASPEPEDAARAIQACERGLKSHPGNCELLMLRGWAQFLPGRDHTQAEKDLRKALKVKASHPEAGRIRGDAHSGLGFIHVRRKEAARALAAAAQALQEAGDQQLTVHNVAGIFAELSDLERDPDRCRELQDASLKYLRRAVDIWQRDRKGPDEVESIKMDSSFDSLRKRDKYKELIKEAKK